MSATRARWAQLAALYDGPSPTARRIAGIRDGRHRGIRMARDRDYLSGYAYGESLARLDRERATGRRGTDAP